MERILENKLGETDPEYLKSFCVAIAEFALMDIDNFKTTQNDMDNMQLLKDIHKFIYKDVFEWAGTIREDYQESTELNYSMDSLNSVTIGTSESILTKKISHFLSHSITSKPFSYGNTYTSIAFTYLTLRRKHIKFNMNKINRILKSHTDEKQLYNMVKKALESNYVREH